mgnify:CR=1 FL=1
MGGITASVISYELNMSNITCYDFGQYERLHKKYLQTKHEKNNYEIYKNLNKSFLFFEN